jgi:hypothetical protein
MSRRIATFFYGSFMDRDVLKRLEIAVDESEPAMLAGFQIELRPRVNLYRSDRHVVYGAVMNLTHSELARLYSLGQKELEAQGVAVPAGQPTDVYLPEPVIVALTNGSWRAAMCYIAESQAPSTPSEAYVRSVVAAARTLRLPEWYIEHLGSFAPTHEEPICG